MLKTFAMMGVSCETGVSFITDMDHIEKSNLSRQFLFRNEDINKPKSITAARAVTRMNPRIRLSPMEQKVCSETENIFHDDFYENVDIIVTALDNVEARLYVDNKAVFYQKVLLESGTLGMCMCTGYGYEYGYEYGYVVRLTTHNNNIPSFSKAPRAIHKS
ncbi:hypothetical protein EON63_22740 [archaeon]|nr:MAG: hypothetical protein EON63_22740 [archaeon]